MTDSKIPATFGAWVRTRRRQLDLTQSELGKRAGCSAAAIRKIEADERKPSRQLAGLLLQALEIPTSEKEHFLQFARGAIPEAFGIVPRTNPNNLPALLTSTVERKQDQTTVFGLFMEKSVRLVTLIGPPGIGKTRLSIHCAESLLDGFPDGVWFVDLANITSPDFFLSTLARSLPGLNLPPAPNLAQFTAELRDKHLLLILDNFEQIVEEAGLEVAKILKACPKIRVLVTSRVALHVYGEHEYALPALSNPPLEAERNPETLMQFEAVQLFVARTRQHQPQFKITDENAGVVFDICTALDGIPLALELAAATLRQMSLMDMASMLRGLSGENWIRQIGTPSRDLPERQRTLENVVDWSYVLLTDEQKIFFSQLGVFSNWFDLETAAAVCMEAHPIAHLILNALTNHSLLVHEILQGKSHWRMLELIHEYAVSGLDEVQRARVERRRAEYFSHKLRTLSGQDVPRSERDSFYQINLGNLLAALNWAIKEKQTELGFQLVLFLDEAWSFRGYLKEGLELVHRLMNLPDVSGPGTRAQRLEMASDLAWQQHDFDSAFLYARQAMNLGRAHGLRQTYPWYLNRLGRIYIEQEKYDQAKTLLEECLAMAYVNRDVLSPGSPLAQLGEVSLFDGRWEEARSLLEEALTYLDDEDGIFLAIAKTDLAEIALLQGEQDKARNWLVEAYKPASFHIRRWLVFLCTLAGYFVLSGKSKMDIYRAVQFYGAIEVLGMKSGINFNSFYKSLNHERLQMARSKITEREWRKAYAEGRSWSREESLERADAELNT